MTEAEKGKYVLDALFTLNRSKELILNLLKAKGYSVTPNTKLDDVPGIISRTPSQSIFIL